MVFLYKLGNPHSAERFILLGAISGFLIGGLSSIFNLNLPWVCLGTSLITGWLSGIDIKEPEESRKPKKPILIRPVYELTQSINNIFDCFKIEQNLLSNTSRPLREIKMTETWFTVDQPEDDSYWKKRFNDNLQNKKPWVQQADELMYSAKLLHEKLMDGLKKLSKSAEGKFEELKIFCSFNLLSGYALENYLKGLIIKEFSQNRKIELEDILGHDLIKLSSKTSLTLNRSEKELLNRLTHFSIWAGRYPIPKEFQEMKPKKNIYGYVIGSHYYKSEDLNTIQEIIKKIKEKLNNQQSTTV